MKTIDQQMTALNQAAKDISHELLHTTDAQIKAELEAREECYHDTLRVLNYLKSLGPVVRLIVGKLPTPTDDEKGRE